MKGFVDAIIEGVAPLFAIVWLVMGLVQLAAILAGLEDWLGAPWCIAIVIAVPVAYIPVVGSVLGIMGAIRGFGWSPLFSILLFGWPYALLVIVMALAAATDGISTLFSRFRR